MHFKVMSMAHDPKVKPIKVDGKEKHIMLIGTWAARDLKNDPVWQAAQQNANNRGMDNPRIHRCVRRI